MELHLRELLDELAEKLHLQHGDQQERAEKLRGDVQQALAADEDPHGLSERLTEEAVHFESGHPELADLLRHVANTLAQL